MPSLLVIVFVAQLVIHIVNTLIGSKLNDLLWALYTKLPTSQSQDAQVIAKSKREWTRLAREMGAVSAQDDFAKWARLRREHDKAKATYEKHTATERDFRSTFDRIIGAMRFLSTQGLNFGINSWNSKQPVFWLPLGWLPYQAEWILSCPSAPLGSVSVNVWGFACGCVIGLISEAMRSTAALGSLTEPGGIKKEMKTSQKVPSGGSNVAEKKEL